MVLFMPSIYHPYGWSRKLLEGVLQKLEGIDGLSGGLLQIDFSAAKLFGNSTESPMTLESFHISTALKDIDIPLVHRFLSEQSYWAKNIPLSLVKKSLEHSLCFGGFIGTSQVAFARVVSDYATFANLVDVFVLPEHRGKGFGNALMQSVLAHKELQGLRRFTLATSDAHALYRRFGFTPLANPESFMERCVINPYAPAALT